METFFALQAIWEGDSLVIGEFPAQKRVTRKFDVFFFWPASWINGWVNNFDAGDLRRYRANDDVIVMDNNLLPGSTRAGSTRPGNAELL